jgi:peptidyl-prolyl cis-trans isomerase B (cyclophilin B)
MTTPGARRLLAAAAIVVLTAMSACSTPVAGSPKGVAGSASASGGTADCSYPAVGAAAKPVQPPSDLHPSDRGTVDATITLSAGDLTISLDRTNAPCTVNSFVSLAQQQYFDATICHRLTTAASLKVLQCGDPTATGTGGPGYEFDDELTGQETYQAGVVAMANAGPNTNGSQFFIVYDDSQLNPNYTVFGRVTNGLDVVQGIAAQGVAGGGTDGAPANQVTIRSVTIG